MKYEEIKIELHEIASRNRVYNKKDFRHFKKRLHQIFHNELCEILSDFDAWYVNTPYWHQLGSYIKSVESDGFPEISKKQKKAMLKALHKWSAIACQLKEIEPLVISGYKSEKQKITARTLAP